LENVKKHFENEAEEFDKTIKQLIPLYYEMIDSMVTAIPYNVSDKFKVLDLGCGTGNVSKVVKEKFPLAIIDCIDIAENMIDMAKIKLENYQNINYYTGDFADFDFNGKYDVVVSSLALHHIKTDEEKKSFYTRIYDVLNRGGVFLNSDKVLGSNEILNKIYMEKWVEFMLQNVSKEEVERKWLPQHAREDFPAPLIQHLQWLNEIGFKYIDVIWKYYGSAVYSGTKL